MSFQTAAIVAGVAFLLSFLSGLIGGVPLLDILLRALIWAAVGFGGCLGAEALLRSLVPELFQLQETPAPLEEASGGQSVNITLDDDIPVRTGFVEEVGDEEDSPPPRPREPAVEARPAANDEGGPRAPAPPEPASDPGPGADEEMPEIGSFLDAFKPESTDAGDGTDAPASPGYSEYAPESNRSPASEVTIDGEAQDPVILAKAVQTVMKRDTQGN